MESIKRGINEKWLLASTKTDNDKECLNQILLDGYLNNECLSSGEIIDLTIASYHLKLRRCDAYHCLKMFTEIIKEDLHFLIKDFYTENDKVILDLGANMGFYSLKAASLLPHSKIFSLEPNPDIFELLRQNIENNGFKERVTPLNYAISGQNCDFEFHVTDQASGLGGKYLGELAKSNRSWVDPEKISTRTVKGIRLINLIDQFGLDQVDIVKFDIQGMELEVLVDAIPKLSKIKKIILEPHSEDTESIISNLLTQEGFEMVDREERQYGDSYWINKKLNKTH